MLTGKLLFNFCVTLVVALIATPLYMIITGMIAGAIAPFLILMLGGCFGLAATATIVAALAAKAKGTGSLYGALGLPLMIAFLMLLINAARSIYIVDVSTLTLVRDLGGLISYGVAMTAVSVLLFETIWEE